MSWYQISVTCAGSDASAVSGIMESAGALSVTFVDPIDADPDEAIYEPRPGQETVWALTRVTGLFGDDEDHVRLVERRLVEQLRSVETGAPPGRTPGLEVERLEDRDWVRASRTGLRARCFGEGLWICPVDHPLPAAEGAARAVVRLDPGLAFGSGAHPTTGLCLEWLSRQTVAHRRVLDFGCGSGVLGIAAAVLGAAGVCMVDQDPQAVAAARENATRNAVAERITALPADRLGQREAGFDMVLANILLGPLVTLAPRLAALTKPGGRLCLAGILAHQRAALEQAYAPSFVLGDATERDGWVRLTGTRRIG